MHLFAGVCVTDLAAAKAWYEQLFGTPPTFLPNDTEAVWELAEHRFLTLDHPHDGNAVGRGGSGPFRRYRRGAVLGRIEEPMLVAERACRRQAQPTPAYECNPVMTRLMKNRLNTIATKPTTLIQAAFLSRHPAVERACR